VNLNAQQVWNQNFADTIKEVIIHLVPFLTFPELVALSKSCKHFTKFDISSSASTLLSSASCSATSNMWH
jgi:hypothetical protein